MLERGQRVYDGNVALSALDIVFGDVRPVHQFRVVGPGESLRLVVAVETARFIGHARSLSDIVVA